MVYDFNFFVKDWSKITKAHDVELSEELDKEFEDLLPKTSDMVITRKIIDLQLDKELKEELKERCQPGEEYD